MKLPYFTAAANRNRRQTILFGGVNYSQDTQDGELAESLNLSSHALPLPVPAGGAQNPRHL